MFNRNPQQPAYGREPPSNLPPTPRRRPAPQSGGLRLQPIKHPLGNAGAFANLAAVSPRDFPPTNEGDQYLIINGAYVVTARPIQECQPGAIGLTDAQRTWAQISIGPQEVVEVAPYDIGSQGKQFYLGALNMEVGFASQKKMPETPYDQDKLAEFVIRNFQNQVLAPGQQLLMDVQNVPLRLTVRGVELLDLFSEKPESSGSTVSDPRARGILTPQTNVDFTKDTRTPINLKASARRPAANPILQANFKFEDIGIGGLSKEFSTIFRRAFAARIYPPGLIEQMGIIHTKGILLYGPPGTGKTLIARQIGKMLNAREPKVVNGPEVLNKFVGQSEENIRKLFADAEKEYKEKGRDSGLHIIIFDELDAVCKQRGSGAGGGTGVGDSVVNQLLSKLDGVEQLDNILLIGMTNRKDMIDEALLRPGRLELHVEIGLPDENGRVEILNIKTAKMREAKRLDPGVDAKELAALTKNYSGAELEALVRAAVSYSLQRNIKVGTMAQVETKNLDAITVTRDDFFLALDEIKPMFGVDEDVLKRCVAMGIIHFSQGVEQLLRAGREIVQRVRTSEKTSLWSVLLYGPRGSGKTALAAQLAMESGFPFVKPIFSADFVGMPEGMKIARIQNVFNDAYKSKLSIIVIDNIQLLLEWNPIGPRFSNGIVGALQNMIEKKPPAGHRLLILITTRDQSILDQLGLLDYIEETMFVPIVNTMDDLANVLQQSQEFPKGGIQPAIQQIQEITRSNTIGLGIRVVLGSVIAASETADGPDDLVEKFVEKICAQMARRQ